MGRRGIEGRGGRVAGSRAARAHTVATDPLHTGPLPPAPGPPTAPHDGHTPRHAIRVRGVRSGGRQRSPLPLFRDLCAKM
jgi:hypothetical protein